MIKHHSFDTWPRTVKPDTFKAVFGLYVVDQQAPGSAAEKNFIRLGLIFPTLADTPLSYWAITLGL
jgi:hypothetical protein